MTSVMGKSNMTWQSNQSAGMQSPAGGFKESGMGRARSSRWTALSRQVSIFHSRSLARRVDHACGGCLNQALP